MKILRLFAILCVMLLPFSGCTSQSKECRDYAEWNRQTDIILCDSFNSTLPEKMVVESYGEKYYYKYTQKVLGDPNFVIYISLQFPDSLSYQLEKAKIALPVDFIVLNEKTYYFFQGSLQEFGEYTDGKIYDGQFYNFEIVAADDQNYELFFINAHVWDYNSDEMLIYFLGDM